MARAPGHEANAQPMRYRDRERCMKKSLHMIQGVIQGVKRKRFLFIYYDLDVDVHRRHCHYQYFLF